jgi:hypothetical protein
MVSTGCIAPHNGGYGGGTLAHLLGFDSGCGCGDACQCGECVNGCADCPPDGCDITDSGSACCESGGCPPDHGAHCDAMPACQPMQRIAHLPGESAVCVTSCCTPNACPGPPDVPPPGRFHPVPTQPAFSPRFAPTPYGQAEF